MKTETLNAAKIAYLAALLTLSDNEEDSNGLAHRAARAALAAADEDTKREAQWIADAAERVKEGYPAQPPA